VLAAILLASAGRSAVSATVNIAPLKDNTLIQATNPAAQLSNGLGDISVGRTNQDGQQPPTVSIRRGLVAFDIASHVPPGSIITGVTLAMRDVMGQNGDQAVELHRVLQDWGEGRSFQNGGMGAAASNGDATWLYTFYNAAAPAASPSWTNPGGDFSATVTASALISDDLGGGQAFTWSSSAYPQMLADVQSWLSDPQTNFGWLLLGNETLGQTIKRLNSGESTTPPNAPPVLIVTYVPEPSGLFLAAAAMMGLGAASRAKRSDKRRTDRVRRSR
jgi:hypothetical protein